MNQQKTECSPDQKIIKLYKEVFNDIRPQIEKTKIGLLSIVIHIMLEPDKLEADRLCNSFQIDNQAPLDDDFYRSLEDSIELITSNPNDKQTWTNSPMIQQIKNLIKPLTVSFLPDDNKKIFQIVVKACQILGASDSRKFLDKYKEKQVIDEVGKIHLLDSSSKKQILPMPVALCLVVPASMAGNFKKNDQIMVDDIGKLIDNASYFLCTSPEDANAIWEILDRTDEDIKIVSEHREVYIIINITGAEEMIGKEVPYILKRNLPPNGQGDVTQLACLKYLSVSGLEKFNRV